MFVRKKPNKSGSVSVQIVEKQGRTNRVIESIGCSNDPDDIARLYEQAYKRMYDLQHQPSLPLDDTSEIIDRFLDSLASNQIRVVGPELIFGSLFDQMGLNQINDALFRDVVITRIAYGGSKRKVAEYLRLYRNRIVDTDRIYRLMDRIEQHYKESIETILFAHTQKILGSIQVVFYDMTTLYFEAEEEDDFRKIGFSKDGKFQNPQIMLGLLVGEKGYPIGYELFEGNTWEGHTLIPVLQAFQKRFDLDKPIVVADSGLLSKENINELKAKGYGYIIGARIKNMNDMCKQKILAAKLNEDGASAEIQQKEGTRLILSYSDKRAKKDAHNRAKGLKRLEKRVQSGKLTKEYINNRGYNKYLILKNQIDVAIDYEKYERDSQWDGLKGYITNTDLSSKAVIENYANLWQIEKAFRMSKSDLKIRPVYHRKRARITSHICIAFTAYGIYKELERRLYAIKAPFGVEYARELSKTMYGLSYTYPGSTQEQFKLLGLSSEQKLLYDLAQNAQL